MLLSATALSVTASSAAIGAASPPHTVTPTSAQRSGVLKAFGDPPAAYRCLVVRVAASNHRYATVRFSRARSCEHWLANGVSIIEHTKGDRWRIACEASADSCPLRHVPLSVQRDLGVCPRR